MLQRVAKSQIDRNKIIHIPGTATWPCNVSSRLFLVILTTNLSSLSISCRFHFLDRNLKKTQNQYTNNIQTFGFQLK